MPTTTAVGVNCKRRNKRWEQFECQSRPNLHDAGPEVLRTDDRFPSLVLVGHNRHIGARHRLEYDGFYACERRAVQTARDSRRRATRRHQLPTTIGSPEPVWSLLPRF